MTRLTLILATLAVLLSCSGEAEALWGTRYFLTSTATDPNSCKTEAANNPNIRSGWWRSNNTLLAVSVREFLYKNWFYYLAFRRSEPEIR